MGEKELQDAEVEMKRGDGSTESGVGKKENKYPIT